MIALTVLEEMGITEHETKVFEWSGLIPGINANRSDMITGGMYILKSRCANINFSDPIGVFGDAMLVPKGNPKGINNYEDVIRTGAKLVTGAGFNTVEAAKKFGVPDSQMLLVEGEVGILAAMKAGRADVAVQTFFGAKEHEEKTGGAFEVTDPKLMPMETVNVVGIGFRKTDTEFRDNFNAALARVMTNPEKMLERALSNIFSGFVITLANAALKLSLNSVSVFLKPIPTTFTVSIGINLGSVTSNAPPVFSSCSFAPKKV